MNEEQEFYYALKNIPYITSEMEQALIKQSPFLNQNSLVMVSSYDITCKFIFMDWHIISYSFDYSFEEHKYQKAVMWCSNGGHTNEYYLDTYSKLLGILNHEETETNNI